MEYTARLQHKTNSEDFIIVLVRVRLGEHLQVANRGDGIAKLYVLAGQSPLDAHSLTGEGGEKGAIMEAINRLQAEHPEYRLVSKLPD